MKNWKNLLLTVIAAVMLLGFAALTPSPVITDDAYDAYQSLTDEE